MKLMNRAVLPLLVGLAVFASGGANAAGVPEVRNYLQRYQWRSGALQNRGSGFQIMARHRITVPRAAGLRLHFDHKELGKGVWVRLTTTKDRRVIQLDDRMIRAYRHTSPYLNGNDVWVELVLAARAQSPGASISGLETPGVAPASESICGADDDRTPSNEKVFARMMRVANGSGGCTGTMIGTRCMVSAGHCVDYLNIAQFNVPVSNPDGSPNFPGPEDQYPLEKIYGSEDAGPGSDWSVYRMQPNPVTGMVPGRVQGTLPVSMARLPMAMGTKLRITGYGSDDAASNVTQQTHVGELVKIDGTGLYYEVDTMPGNSGSTVVLEGTREIVGIHTHGGCSTTPGTQNKGTALALKPEFQEAIRQCLADDFRQDQ